MRTHLQIISDAGGYRKLADHLGLAAERVRFWERRRSIPLESWRAVEEAGVATRDELFDAAESAAKERAKASQPEAAA